MIVASDSDYWALVNSVLEARFLIMLEYEKIGFDIKNALAGAGIFYCFINEFHSGSSEDIKFAALLNEARLYLDRYVRINVYDMLEDAYR